MKNQFGGTLLNNKRKSQRPLDFKKTTHLVLRLKERLPAFFNPRDKYLRNLVFKIAQKNHSAADLFSFSISSNELSYAISQINSTLSVADQFPTDIRLYKLNAVNVRNEIGKLQRGTVNMGGKVFLLKATRFYN